MPSSLYFVSHVCFKATVQRSALTSLHVTVTRSCMTETHIFYRFTLKEFLLLDEITKNSPSLPQEKDGRASVEMENLTCYWDKVRALCLFCSVCL